MDERTSPDEHSAAKLQEFDVRMSNGSGWVVLAPSATMFEQALRTNKVLLADPVGTKDTGWHIETAHVVAWRRDD